MTKNNQTTIDQSLGGFITYHKRDGGILGIGSTEQEAEADVVARCAAHNAPPPEREDLETLAAPRDMIFALGSGKRFTWTGSSHQKRAWILEWETENDSQH